MKITLVLKKRIGIAAALVATVALLPFTTNVAQAKSHDDKHDNGLHLGNDRDKRDDRKDDRNKDDHKDMSKYDHSKDHQNDHKDMRRYDHSHDLTPSQRREHAKRVQEAREKADRDHLMLMRHTKEDRDRRAREERDRRDKENKDRRHDHR